MGYFGIKAKATKHTGKLPIDIKTIDSRRFSCKDDVKRFSRLFGYLGGISEAITRSARNNSKIYIQVHQSTCYLAYRSISPGDDNIGYFLVTDNRMKKRIIAAGNRGIYLIRNVSFSCPLLHQ